jgi:hypothetical protein
MEYSMNLTRLAPLFLALSLSTTASATTVDDPPDEPASADDLLTFTAAQVLNGNLVRINAPGPILLDAAFTRLGAINRYELEVDRVLDINDVLVDGLEWVSTRPLHNN